MITRRKLLALPVLLVIPKEAESMTLTKMQAVVSAITNAGFEARAIPNGDGTWRVRASAPTLTVSLTIARNLEVAQNVTGFVSEVEYT